MKANSQSLAQRPAIFLDRDGTIIFDKIYLKDPNQVEYIPGALDALKIFQGLGFHLVVVTNQSGVARGLMTIKDVEDVHVKIDKDLKAEGINMLEYLYAPFSVESNHPMRKPNPGMLLLAAEKHHIDLKRSWMIGDRMTDSDAGHKAGCKSIIVGTTADNEQSHSGADQPEKWFKDLLDAAKWLAQEVSK